MADATTMNDLLKQRTAAEKAVAAAELPVLQQIQTHLGSAELQTVVDNLSPLLDQLQPGNSYSMLKLVLNGLTSVKQVVPQDIAKHQSTIALP